MTEIADTFNFTLVGTESYDDRETWVIDGDPRPDAELHDKDSKFLSNFRGRLWIDKSDLQLAKMGYRGNRHCVGGMGASADSQGNARDV